MKRNSIGMEVPRIDLDGLRDAFGEVAFSHIVEKLARPGVNGVGVFRNLQMDSSQFGHQTAVIFGPACTYETLEQLTEGRLGDVPSRFQYPVAYYSKYEQ